MSQSLPRLPRYRILYLLGQGDQADVFAAMHESSGTEVAVKMPRQSLDAEARERFRREIRAIEKISHPNVIRILDTSREGEPVFFAMEKLSATSLKDWLAQVGRLPIPTAINLSIQLLSALHQAHATGVAHRDVKPANIMFASDGRAVLTDFGIALLVDATRLTQTHSTMGTPWYMSPEQAAGEPGGPLGDLYSAGVILYQMLVGRVPFHSENVAMLVHMHRFQTPPSPRSIDPNLPVALESLVLRSLAKRPQDRFGGARAMLRELERASTALGLSPAVSAGRGHRRAGAHEGSDSDRIMLGLAATLVAILLILLLLALFGTS